MSERVYTVTRSRRSDGAVTLVYEVGEWDVIREEDDLHRVINAQNERIAALEAHVVAQGIRIDSLLSGFGEPLK